MRTTSIGDALFTKSQQKVLGLLYARPDKSFYTNEIMRWASMGRGTISRELDKLVGAGLLTLSKTGNQNHYQANSSNPVYDELVGIVRKTFGIADEIRTALTSLTTHIDCAFVFGSVASGKESSDSDIDLMIIGDVSFTQVVSALYSTQEGLRREINPKIYTKEEWSHMVKIKDAFITEVLAKPRINVIGDINESG